MKETRYFQDFFETCLILYFSLIKLYTITILLSCAYGRKFTKMIIVHNLSKSENRMKKLENFSWQMWQIYA